MTKVISLRLRDNQVERLRRAARRMGRTPSETAALLLEEALRQREFAFLEYRDTAVGREAFIKGTRLKIWQVVSIARACHGDIAKTAAHLEISETSVSASLNYAAAYLEEIDVAIAENEPSVEELRRLVPSLEVVSVDAPVD